jgi:CysZ protein
MKISDIFRGAGYLIEGFGLIRRPGLRRFVLLPLLINICIFIGLIYLGGSYFDQAMERLLPESVGWLGYILWPLFALLVLITSFYSFTLLANLIGGPFNDRLAEMVAERLGARPNTDHGRSLVGDIGVSVFNELRKWLYFLGLFLMLLLMWLLTFWIPPLTLLMPLLWLLLATWMMSVEYTDYPMSNQGMCFAEKRAWLRRHRSLAIGFGGATLGATLIPIVNFAVMPAAVAGATVLWVRHGDRTPST